MRSHSKGFTLGELIVTLFILSLLAGIAIPSFNRVIYNSKYNITLEEAGALEREAMAYARQRGRFMIESGDFGDNDMNRYLDGVQLATGDSPWTYTSKHNIQATISDMGIVTGIDGYGSTSIDLGVNSSDGGATIVNLGTFVDSFNDVSINRDANKVTLNFTRANWEYIITSYSSSADQLYKSSGPNTVGVIVRNSNTNIDINLAKNVNYTVLIKFNGSSSGTTYTFQAVA